MKKHKKEPQKESPAWLVVFLPLLWPAHKRPSNYFFDISINICQTMKTLTIHFSNKERHYIPHDHCRWCSQNYLEAMQLQFLKHTLLGPHQQHCPIFHKPKEAKQLSNLVSIDEDMPDKELTKWCKPRGPVLPMYIAGLFLTASKPSRT